MKPGRFPGGLKPGRLLKAAGIEFMDTMQTAAPFSLACPRCSRPIESPAPERGADRSCPACGAGLRVDTYPALFRYPDPGARAAAAILENETSCFYHAGKRAVVPCDVCGRFLCALCDIHLDGRHLCPACMEAGAESKQIGNLENQRILYDKIAMYLALIPFTVVFWFAAFITAPAALFVVIRYWKEPNSLVSGSRVRKVVAFLLALIQVAGCAVLIYNLFKVQG